MIDIPPLVFGNFCLTASVPLVGYDVSMSTRIHIVVDDELLGLVEADRGDVSRSRWVVRAIEAFLTNKSEKRALEETSGGVAASGLDSGRVPVAGSVPVRPASPRASSLEPVPPRRSSVRVPGVVRASSLVGPKPFTPPRPKQGEK